jgi:hypothetical protein
MLIRNAGWICSTLVVPEKGLSFCVSVVFSSRKFTALRSIVGFVPKNSFCVSVVFLLCCNVQFLGLLFTVMFIALRSCYSLL